MLCAAPSLTPAAPRSLALRRRRAGVPRAAAASPGATAAEAEEAWAQAAVARLADGGVSTPREAWALLTRGGWQPLDVRTDDEHSYPLTAGAAHVPIITSPWRFDASSKSRTPAAQKRNATFLRDVVRRFPDASTPLLVHCSDGTARSMATLRALDAVGYTRLAGVKGGYNAFTREFDAKLAWRHTDEAYDAQGGRDMWREVEGSAAFSSGQTTGLNHGNSFQRMDNPDNLFPRKDPVTWINVEFTDAEIAEAAASLAALLAKAQAAAPAPAPAMAAVAVAPSPEALDAARRGWMAAEAAAKAQAAAPSPEALDAARQAWAMAATAAKAQPRRAEPAPAAAGPGQGESHGEYVIFRF